jgi:divalent metal cation (Fe/Co/Zn/Cd) transporter
MNSASLLAEALHSFSGNYENRATFFFLKAKT